MGLDRRRQFLIALGATWAAPRLRAAQSAKHAPVVGVLGPEAPSALWPDGFAARVRKFGLEPGRDFVLDVRWTGGNVARLPKLAEQLAASGVAVIVATGNISVEAARRATRTLPIVMLGVQHPVENGYIRSLATPGGNVTGVTWAPPEIAGKNLELIRDAVPGSKRIAVLVNPDYPGMRLYADHTDRAAAAYGMTLKRFPVRRPEDLAPALEQVAAYKPDALYVVSAGEIGRREKEVAAHARKNRLLSFGASPTWVASGGILQYLPDYLELVERGAYYVARLLRGAKAAELPVELPRTYQFVVNAKAAREIGHTIPALILSRADRVIE